MEIIKMFFYKSLDGWTFAFYSYYMENITRLLDNPYFQVMTDIIDPYGRSLDNLYSRTLTLYFSLF